MWNKVEDVLPTGRCLVVQVGFSYHDNFNLINHEPMVSCMDDYFQDNGNIFHEQNQDKYIAITHWMPLPELPKK